MSASRKNPWQAEGVSLLPDNLAELMPLVGQKRLFEKLVTFREEILGRGAGQDLAGFYMVIGGWGLGKSRVGHEICLEAISDDVDWIVDGAPTRLLEAGLQQGILPIFLRYVQVKNGPHGEKLEADNWIPSVVVEGLARLAEMRADSGGKTLARNQDRLLKRTRDALKPKGWDRELESLRQALGDASPARATRKAMEILGQLGIKNLWLIVDEIEDITDVQRDGLYSDERKGIDQALLTVIPRVIKSEEARQEYPGVNFLLLCSQAVGDLLRQIRAIERRTGWHELTANTFTDVEAFFSFLEVERPELREALKEYPSGLREAAFFAANRNFGWFNVILYHAHENLRGGRMGAPELLRSFAQKTTKGGRDSVFDQAALSDYRLDLDQDRDEVERAIYGLLPQEVGSGDLTDERALHFLAKRDHGGRQRPIFTRVVEIDAPAKHLITSHLVSCGFENPSGTEMVLRGEARFDLRDVIEGLQAYAICLPKERRGHMLVCEELEEFVDQVRGLSPYPEEAALFAEYLHGFLMNSATRAKRDDGGERWFVAPAFSFLLDFNRLNKVRRDEQGYLRDSTKNTRLQERWVEVTKDREQKSIVLLRGVVHCWETDRAPVEAAPVPGLRLPSMRWQSLHRPLSLAESGHAVALLLTGGSETDLEHDLMRLAQKRVEPILLVLVEEDQRLEELRQSVDRTAPRIAPFVAMHNLARVTANEHLVRLGLLGDAFEPADLRTSHFHAAVGRAHEHLKRTLDRWLAETAEGQGLLLKPLFYGSRVGDDEIAAFGRGYAAMLEGKSYHELTQSGAGVFADDAQRDAFKKLVDRNVEPPAKHAAAPLESLIERVSGEHVARVPRSLISIIERCGPVSVRLRDLEERFLFDVRDEQGKEIAKARDVLRHITTLLLGLGLLNADGEKLGRVSGQQLELHVKSATAWLDGRYEQDARAIRKIHEAAGDELLNVRLKDARHRLKLAGKSLESLKLDFIGKPWSELNRDSDDEMPVYEDRLRAALRVVRGVEEGVRWVFDPEALALFRYNEDALSHFDTHGKTDSYPLWRRIAVLSGFYEQLSKERKELSNRIDAVLADVRSRVFPLESGEPAFPTQPVERPMELFRQELNFSADNPERTVAAGSTTLGVSALGYKLASSKYVETKERLGQIRSELFDPGKIVSAFLLTLDGWEQLREETGKIDQALKKVETFFADAPNDVRQASGLSELQDGVDELCKLVNGGGIRHQTDARETAGTRVTQLVHGLTEDLRQVSDQPRRIRDQLDEILPNVLRSLEVSYQSENKARLNALTRIRTVKGESLPTWPNRLDVTYAATVAAFDKLVETIDCEGSGYFKGSEKTRFTDFVALCDMAMDGKAIDWDDAQFREHRDVLIARKLLQLRLV